MTVTEIQTPEAPAAETPAAPVQLTARALRAALKGIPDDALIRTPAGPAGVVTTDNGGVLIGRLAKSGSANRPNVSISQAERGPALAEYVAKALGRKAETTVTQAELAADGQCSEFVISYSMRSEFALAAFAAKSITVSGPVKKIYTVSRKQA